MSSLQGSIHILSPAPVLSMKEKAAETTSFYFLSPILIYPQKAEVSRLRDAALTENAVLLWTEGKHSWLECNQPWWNTSPTQSRLQIVPSCELTAPQSIRLFGSEAGKTVSKWK